MTNPFFKNYGPIKLKDIYKVLNINNDNNNKTKIFDITDLNSASIKDITFFHSNKYKTQAQITKAAACITTKNLASKFKIPLNKVAIEVNMEIIDKKKLNKIIIKSADKIEIVQFIGGG